jgi:large subunit ribosomal protein L22
MVDNARVLKRMRPAPQGRGYRIRKRSNMLLLWLMQSINKAVSGKGIYQAGSKRQFSKSLNFILSN